MDFNTLFAVNIFGMTLCAIALTMNAVGSRNVRIPTTLVLCSLSGATGMLLLMLYGRVAHVYSVVLGSFFLQLSFVFMYHGYSWMTQLPRRSLLMRGWWVLLGVTLTTTAAITYYVLYTDLILPRLILFSVGIIIGAVACILLLLRVPDVFLREASWLSILCLSIYVVMNALRLVQGILHPPTVALLQQTTSAQTATILVNMMALAGMTYGHIWITGARQRLVLQSQAYTDELTGVLNRRALELEAEREISRSRRNQVPLAVMMCDLDNFKIANDTLGHQYGDALLRAAANVLRSTLRKEDLIARFGGDEFVILLPGASRDRALEAAERLRGEIERMHVVDKGRNEEQDRFMGLHASFGMAMLDSVPQDNWHLLVQRPDAALYAAKHVGGNHIIMDPVPLHVQEQLQMQRVGMTSGLTTESSSVVNKPNIQPGSTRIQ